MSNESITNDLILFSSHTSDPWYVMLAGFIEDAVTQPLTLDADSTETISLCFWYPMRHRYDGIEAWEAKNVKSMCLVVHDFLSKRENVVALLPYPCTRFE